MKLLNKKTVTALGLSAYTLLFNVQMVLADDKGALLTGTQTASMPLHFLSEWDT